MVYPSTQSKVLDQWNSTYLNYFTIIIIIKKYKWGQLDTGTACFQGEIIFPSRLGIAQERPGACSAMLGMIVDSSGVYGPAIGMRGYGGRRLESNDMETKNPRRGLPCGG